MTLRKLMTIRECLEDPDYLGSKDMLAGTTWKPWRTVLIAAMGEKLRADERAIFRDLTGRDREPGKGVEELWCIVGRRGGKSRAIASLAAYLAAGIDYRGVLAPGQYGLVPIIAASREQAGEIFNYCCGIFAEAPGFAGLLSSPPTANVITLKTRVELQVRAASFRRARGFTAVAAIGDEVAFWSVESSANPDSEILNALRPSLATTGGILAMISSPYARRGELYNAFRRDFGPDGDPRVLVVKAPSKSMNPGLSDRIIERAYEKDAAVASAEYGAEFRSDVEAFLTREVVEAAIPPGLRELSPSDGVQYAAFVDPSGGASDSMTLAIGHREGDDAVLDAIRERKPPFSPDAVVAEFAEVLRSYGLAKVEGDRYGGLWPRERFEVHGITYETAERPKSELYGELLPILNSGRCRLLDDPKLVAQLVNLERRTARGGRDSIDHAPNGHDDTANAVAGVITKIIRKPHTIELVFDSLPNPAMTAQRDRETGSPTIGGLGGLFEGDLSKQNRPWWRQD